MLISGKPLIDVLTAIAAKPKAAARPIKWMARGIPTRDVTAAEALARVSRGSPFTLFIGKVAADKKRVHDIRERDQRIHLRDDNYQDERAVIKYHADLAMRKRRWAVNAHGQNVLEPVPAKTKKPICPPK